MEFITAIRKIVSTVNAEEAVVNLRRRVNFIRRFIPVSLRHKFASVGKFIPHSAEYPKDDSYSLTRDNTHFRINRSDYVQWRLFYGVRDNALREAKKHLQSDSVVLDIGASFGAFSLKLATFTAERGYSNVQIHAFEPNPEVFKNYAHNLSLNTSLTNMIRLHPVGLGNETSERSFGYEEFNSGAGRVLQQGTNGRFNISIRKLDDFINELNPSRIAFIKLIAEGFEPEVFRGGWQTITKYKPPIFFEVTEEWWKENNASIEDILSPLRALGYQFMIEHYNEMLPYEATKYASRIQFNLMATVAK